MNNIIKPGTIPSGVININKPTDFTSFDVVAKLRKILGIRKIGHTGTLDPMATGVLPVCVGKATSLVDMLTKHDKVYETTLLLGKTTDTQDITGEVLSESTPVFDPEKIKETIFSFTGDIEQIPPMYSAKKVGGKKLYDLARAGIEIERKPAHIKIYDIKILKEDFPRYVLSISCGRGTYIRTLCHDIGQNLGYGGCMETLKRTRVGEFEIEKSYDLNQIGEMTGDGDYSFLIPIDSFFTDLPGINISDFDKKKIENGAFVYAKDYATDGFDSFRVYLPDNNNPKGKFAGIYKRAGKLLKPEKMFLE